MSGMIVGDELGLELVESRVLRARHAARVEVLEKVGQLALLPGTAFATVEQVAEFYAVGVQAIKSLVHDHRDELNSHGYRVLNGIEIASSLRESAKLSPKARHLAVFPRSAVLLVGMLLRDSPVARSVRGYLLAVEQKATPDQRQAAVGDVIAGAHARLGLIAAAKGLVAPSHLEALTRIELARGLGTHPQLDPASTPLYAHTFLEEKGLTRQQIRSIAPLFGKRLKAAYIAQHGHDPGQYPLTSGSGQVRMVNAYTETDRPLLEHIWTRYWGGQ